MLKIIYKNKTKLKDIHCSYFHLKVTGSLKSSTILPLGYKNQITSAFMVK